MKYRKKPVIIDAVEFNNSVDVLMWVESFDGLIPQIEYSADSIKIHTLEGVMEATRGDYIIRGVAGEFYPCKPNIFEKTYEVAEQEIDK